MDGVEDGTVSEAAGVGEMADYEAPAVVEATRADDDDAPAATAGGSATPAAPAKRGGGGGKQSKRRQDRDRARGRAPAAAPAASSTPAAAPAVPVTLAVTRDPPSVAVAAAAAAPSPPSPRHESYARRHRPRGYDRRAHRVRESPPRIYGAMSRPEDVLEEYAEPPRAAEPAVDELMCSDAPLPLPLPCEAFAAAVSVRDRVGLAATYMAKHGGFDAEDMRTATAAADKVKADVAAMEAAGLNCSRPALELSTRVNTANKRWDGVMDMVQKGLLVAGDPLLAALTERHATLRAELVCQLRALQARGEYDV